MGARFAISLAVIVSFGASAGGCAPPARFVEAMPPSIDLATFDGCVVDVKGAIGTVEAQELKRELRSRLGMRCWRAGSGDPLKIEVIVLDETSSTSRMRVTFRDVRQRAFGHLELTASSGDVAERRAARWNGMDAIAQYVRERRPERRDVALTDPDAGENDSPKTASGERPRPTRTPGPMTGVRATTKTEALAAAGLDVRNLPPIEKLPAGQKRKVMQIFSETLGVPCIGCHDEETFVADTRRKRVAKRMYNEIVRVLELANGDPIFCDSCHDGRLFPLDRRNKSAVAQYMSTSLCGSLRRVDGRDHDCTTCHGDPPDFHLIARWKEERAPDMDPTVEPASLPPSRSAYSPTTEECEKNPKLCPLQQWMRKSVTTALVDNDAKLAFVLDETAAFSPDPSSSWATIAQRGAEAARARDMKAVKAACGDCHRQYKQLWRTSHRTHDRP